MEDFKYTVKLLRPKQWIKNLFVLGPIIFSNNLLNFDLLLRNFITFISFCLISSAAYILNDIVDKESDKKHPVKCNRPIASGKVNLLQASIVGIMLCLISLSLAISLNKYIAVIICLYVLNNIAYFFN